MKSPDTRVGKWALHTRWGKWDLKRLNRSDLPGNAAQQPPAQISALSLFFHPPLCSHNTSVTVSCVNIILGSCSRTGASDMGSVTIAPTLCCRSRMVKPSTPGNWCLWDVHWKQKSPELSCKKCWESHWGMCHSPNTTPPHASAVKIFLVQLNATSYKHLGLKSKITSSDSSTLAVPQTGKAVTGRGHVSPPNDLGMLQYF